MSIPYIVSVNKRNNKINNRKIYKKIYTVQHIPRALGSPDAWINFWDTVHSKVTGFSKLISCRIQRTLPRRYLMQLSYKPLFYQPLKSDVNHPSALHSRLVHFAQDVILSSLDQWLSKS